MANLAGLLGVSDASRTYLNTVGQKLVFEAANKWLAAHNADMQAFQSVFVEGETEDYTFRYKLPGGGRLQRRSGQAQSGTTKPTGAWDVAFPLEEFGSQIAYTEDGAAEMTVQDMQLHLDAVRTQDINTMRFELLKALFNNTARTFVDEIKGSLTIQPLANNDAVNYPPVLGSESEAGENHYIETGYAPSAISDTNNPYETGRNDLEEHFGTPSGFGNVVAFINPDAKAKTEALTDYDPVNDSAKLPGSTRDVVTGAPMVPGRLLGRTSGVWVAEWRWIPATYMLFIDLDQPRPLMIRRPGSYTGFPRGLALRSTDTAYPFRAAHYSHRFGVGAGNRLNGVVLELANGGSYTIPTAFA